MANFNAIQTGVLIKALIYGGTAEDIVAKTGYNICTVYRYTRQWHKQGVIYISRWRKSHISGRIAAVWEMKVCDSQHDAPRPAQLTSKERSRNYMKRKVERLAQEMYEQMKEKR